VQATIEKLLLELIDGFAGLINYWFEAEPGEGSQGNRVSPTATQATRIALQAGDLLVFTVKLLNGPTNTAFCVGVSCPQRISKAAGEPCLRGKPTEAVKAGKFFKRFVLARMG
jgi:hypothetical protein